MSLIVATYFTACFLGSRRKAGNLHLTDYTNSLRQTDRPSLFAGLLSPEGNYVNVLPDANKPGSISLLATGQSQIDCLWRRRRVKLKVKRWLGPFLPLKEPLDASGCLSSLNDTVILRVA